MKSEFSICRLIVLLIVLTINFTIGELEFYQDVEPQISEDINYKTLKRILKLQNHQNEMHLNRGASHPYPLTYEDYLLKHAAEKQKTIFDILFENPRIFEMLQQNKLKNMNYQRQPDYDILNEYPRSIIERERPYINLNSLTKSYEYPNINIPYPESNVNDKMYFSHGGHNPVQMSYPIWKKFENNLEDNSMQKQQNNIIDSEVSKLTNTMKVNSMPNLSEKWNEPKFTYKFDEPSTNEYDTFAIKPNDPRYYYNDKVSSNSRIDIQTKSNNNDLQTAEVPNEKKTMTSVNHKTSFQLSEPETINGKFLNFRNEVPDIVRQPAHEIITAKTTGFNFINDIYFFGFVAGCSAAIMFALVLISLTWCRSQRGAKAAADIDYPAYGITGPNKDISPSGDQRLAHSAQMYHFQHQKQQIIAMEKSATAREPGSVSEAESDEENEEGDYTVYECPGLAPAGELEVKNPLFHDDPTPATPSQNHKDVDHSTAAPWMKTDKQN